MVDVYGNDDDGLTKVSTVSMCSFPPRQIAPGVEGSELDSSYLIDTEYSCSWTEISTPSVEGRYELRIKLLSALGLGDPCYRIGDFVKKKWSGLTLNACYAKVILGDRCAKTSLYPRPCQRAVYFENERMLFVHSGEPFIQLRMLSKHTFFRDALVGKANVPIVSEFLDGFAHQVDVDLFRKHGPTGTFSMQIQMTPM